METTRKGAKTLRADYREWKKLRRLMERASRKKNRPQTNRRYR